MDDHEYVTCLKILLKQLNKCRPGDQDEVVDYNKFLDKIRLLNSHWKQECPEHD